ncbi:hypothetical protein PHLCEN_2v6413 [Hermanssonia centrifuga]|uniref:Uncharacterized protein n=1 Tax=Hermanssonia centrifuga TaxID=98765 RepID=A0A2R6NZK3_9APHY|nr:hypothetical protein PHLCEN_2v6413 [Hermanssonia centrifuga]
MNIAQILVTTLVVYGEQDVPSLTSIIGNMGQNLDHGFEEELSEECHDDIVVGEISALDTTFDDEELAVEDSAAMQEVRTL